MKRTIIFLLAVAFHLGVQAQHFIDSSGMSLRNDLAYTLDSIGIDTIQIFDPVDRRLVDVIERRTEITSINGIIPLGNQDVTYTGADLQKFEQYISAFFKKELEKTPYKKGTFRLHICGIIVDENGRICKYEYHNLDMNDADGIPRDVYPIAPGLIQRIMAAAPPVRPHRADGNKAKYAYLPEVILSRKYKAGIDKTVITESTGTPDAKHAHRTPRLDKRLY